MRPAVLLLCKIVPTVELILTFRFSNTLIVEFAALMLMSELKFCCALPPRLTVPVVVVFVELEAGWITSDPTPDTRPFAVGTAPEKLMTPPGRTLADTPAAVTRSSVASSSAFFLD